MKKFIFAIVTCCLIGCSDPQTAQKILEIEGYENIHLEGWTMWGCGKDDNYTTSFTATKNGKPVKGVVCSSFWGKGAVIRVIF